MKKILFACDLDNTLIHSHKIKNDNDICVEIFDGKQQSFITPRTSELLKKIYISDNITLLPVTTRSIEQYSRIKWENYPEFALVTNGTITLKNGVIFTREDVSEYYPEIQNLFDKIKNIPDFLKVKIVDGMYLFAYCTENADVKTCAERCSGLTSLNTQYSGRKIYFFPPAANKGTAVKKFAENFGFDFIISAGDSSIDCPMLEIADISIVPDKNISKDISTSDLRICPENTSFSEFILETVLSINKFN